MQRRRVNVNVGNLLELLGAVCAVWGVDRLAGFAWALVLAGILIMLAAELVYDAHLWHVPVPRKPQPRRWLKERRQALRKRGAVLVARARERARKVSRAMWP